MNKVYKFSKNILKMSIPLSVILGISSCASYQSSSQIESDGVYYNPSVDKTYADVEAQNSINNGDIRVGAPYFDANGNGAEDIFYGETTTQAKAENVNINVYGASYGLFPASTNYLGSLGNNSDWGRNDGVNITIYNNPWMSYGFNRYWRSWGMYNPWHWGFDPFYNSMWGWSGNFGSIWNWGWGWNRPWYGNSFGGYWGWNHPFYSDYYGSNWGFNRPFYYDKGFQQNNLINSRPGNRPSRELINTMPAGRENILSRPGTTNRPTREIVSPDNNFNSNNAITRPSREVRPSTDFNSNNAVTRPTREVKPSTDFNSNNAVTRPTREVRPSREFNSNNATTSPNRGNVNAGNREARPMRQPSTMDRQTQYPTQQSRPQMQDRGFEGRTPTYSSPSPSMSSPSSSTMGTSSSSGGSRSGGSGRR